VPQILTKLNGDVITGVVVNLKNDSVTINTDASDPWQRVNVKRREVKSIDYSHVSPMPPALINMLSEDEVLDLLSYVISGGDKSNEIFK